MFITNPHPSIRPTGRWHTENSRITSTANGSYFEIACEGEMIVLHFDMQDHVEPRPQLWISADGGPRVLSEVTPFLRLQFADAGRHEIRVVIKSTKEMANRWYAPLQSKVCFKGYDAEAPAELTPDERKIIEFVGDSITEGVLVDDGYEYYADEADNRPYVDDSCGTYAWQTAENLNLRPIICGYGAVGTIRTGCGSVPPVGTSYPYCFDGAPIECGHPDYIVINHSTNDQSWSAEEVEEKYFELLRVISATHPDAKMFAMTPFLGCFDEAIRNAVERFAAEGKNEIRHISTKGWIPREPTHPNREGHRLASKRLTEVLGEFIHG